MSKFYIKFKFIIQYLQNVGKLSQDPFLFIFVLFTLLANPIYKLGCYCFCPISILGFFRI